LTTDESARIDPTAVEALYAAHADELRAFLIAILRNGDLAQEVVQGTFEKLVELGHTAREESLKGWLFRVAYHEAIVLRRKQNVHQRSLRKLAELDRREQESPERDVQRQDVAEQVRQSLDRLTPEQWIIVQKRIYEAKTFADIAGELAIPLGTVLTRMRAALSILRSELKEDEE
jgi:RNA polymerase sigma factor (sigma-70 family)